ncbi:MAG: adenylate/guanylate cyclase domain-containing protein [Alphaproteobacteria bacterium]
MTNDVVSDEEHLRQLRLFLEELCSELCRFQHVVEDGLAPEEVRISREVSMDAPGSYADMRVQVPGQPPYFVEIKFAYPPDKLVAHISRKYGAGSSLAAEAKRLVLLIRSTDYPNWPDIEANIRSVLPPRLDLDVWDEGHLLRLIRDRFGVEISGTTGDDVLAVRQAIDDAKWRHAYGIDFVDHPLASSLLWHFGFWALRRFNDEQGLEPHEVLRPGLYRNVTILMADLCAFSSYVRDTRDDELVRHCLTRFYSQARYAIINTGGMMYQFVGDQVVGLFGVPGGASSSEDDAIECARALIDIGNSVSIHWQRELDRVQKSGGVHIGLAIGDLNLMPLRPFSASHVGFVGDSLNMAARLLGEAGPSEIVVSNNLYQRLDPEMRGSFHELPPVEAKNVGLIRCWKLAPGVSGTARLVET